jgi:hypothetical protein
MLMSEQKRFAEPDDLAVFTTRSIVFEGQPILRIVHDSDGDWQFLDGGDVDVESAAVVGLYEIVERDPSVLECSDLPKGWVAFRSHQQDLWKRQPR